MQELNLNKAQEIEKHITNMCKSMSQVSRLWYELYNNDEDHEEIAEALMNKFPFKDSLYDVLYGVEEWQEKFNDFIFMKKWTRTKELTCSDFGKIGFSYQGSDEIQIEITRAGKFEVLVGANIETFSTLNEAEKVLYTELTK